VDSDRLFMICLLLFSLHLQQSGCVTSLLVSCFTAWRVGEEPVTHQYFMLSQSDFYRAMGMHVFTCSTD